VEPITRIVSDRLTITYPNEGVATVALDIFINFNGNCEEAVLFYASVFGKGSPEFMRFKDAAPDPSFPIPEKDKNLIMFSSLNLFGTNVMFSDVLPGMDPAKGNNISLTVVSKDMDEVKRLFHSMAASGTITMELQETFWSKCYGNVTDKYGIQWQFSHDGGQ
jgi:PhnB protein